MAPRASRPPDSLGATPNVGGAQQHRRDGVGDRPSGRGSTTPRRTRCRTGRLRDGGQHSQALATRRRSAVARLTSKSPLGSGIRRCRCHKLDRCRPWSRCSTRSTRSTPSCRRWARRCARAAAIGRSSWSRGKHWIHLPVPQRHVRAASRASVRHHVGEPSGIATLSGIATFDPARCRAGVAWTDRRSRSRSRRGQHR